jgi:anti-sigma28 factor (negative regulator of flagellin synthesis)
MPTDGLKWGGLPAAESLASPQAPAASAVSAAAPDVERERLVEALRRAVATGAYRVDGLEVADRLLEGRSLEGGEG